MKHIFILCLFVLLALNANGQSQNVDSLVNVLETQKLTDDEKIELYWDIGKLYANRNYDNCIKYAKKGLLLAKERNNKRRMVNFNTLSGVSYYLKNSFDTSYVFLDNALKLAVELKDKELESNTYGNIGNMYKHKNELHTAVDYYMRSLALNDSINKYRASVLANLGAVHRSLYHWDRAEKYLNEALDVAEKLNLKNVEMAASHTLANIYADKAELGKAKELYKKSLDLSRVLNDKQYEVLSNMALAANYAETKDYDIAIGYGNEALQIIDEIGITHLVASSHAIMCEVYRKAGRYNDSKKMGLVSWAIDSTSINIGANTAMNLALANIHLNNKYEAEYFVLKLKTMMSEGIDKQMNESLADMEVKYETEKKEMRIASLEKERQFHVWLGIAGVLLILSLGVVLWLNIRNSQKERQLVASNAVQEGEMGERERIAGELHDRLLGSLSAIKSETYNTDISNKLNGCIEEVRRISGGLMPIALRSGIKIALEDFTAQFSNVRFHFFGQEKRIAKRIEFVVYCCVSELVVNSVRHSGAKNINVQLVQGEKHIALTVQDDGCGFDEKTVTKGVGLRSIRNRVASCNGKIDIFSSPRKGTETVIEINI
jgi:Signal transduction histidine kinase